jgi:hypothetical protein
MRLSPYSSSISMLSSSRDWIIPSRLSFSSFSFLVASSFYLHKASTSVILQLAFSPWLPSCWISFTASLRSWVKAWASLLDQQGILCGHDLQWVSPQPQLLHRLDLKSVDIVSAPFGHLLRDIVDSSLKHPPRGSSLDHLVNTVDTITHAHLVYDHPHMPEIGVPSMQPRVLTKSGDSP